MPRLPSPLTLACLAASAAAFAPAPVYKAPKPKGLLERMLGKWEKTNPLRNDLPMVYISKGAWVYGGCNDKGTGQEYQEHVLTLDATKNPATVTLKAALWELRGIVKVEGDTLTILFGEGKVYPANFEAAGRRAVYRRAK